MPLLPLAAASLPSAGPAFFLILALVFTSGVLTSFQHGMNRRFSTLAGNAIHGGILNFIVGLLATLLLWAILTRAHLPSRAVLTTGGEHAGGGPWWMWLGGVCGAVYVCAAVYALPRIGSAYHVSALVIGQLLAATIIDHFGLMGLDVKPATTGKAIGLLLMVAGVVCMKFA